LASVAGNQKATTGALTAAISTFLAKVTSPEGGQFGDGPYLLVQHFVEEIRNQLECAGQSLATVHTTWPSLGPSFCLLNPRYRPEDQPVPPARRDLALRLEDLAGHWDPRARGAATHDEGGWLFTGRRKLMRQLIQATTANPPA
jgi:hypothetical protein